MTTLTAILTRRFGAPRLGFAAELDEEAPPAPPDMADEPAPPPAAAPAGDARPGFRRHTIGHLLVVLAGLVPLVMLLVYWLRSGQGLSMTMTIFFVLYALGYAASVMQLLYAARLPASQFVPYPLRSFYGIHELVAVAVVLVPMAIYNLVQTHSGTSLTLSKAVASNVGFGTSALFLGGALWGALGYTVAVGIAGLLLGILRRFPVPIGNKMVALPYRMLVGLTTGGAIGFILGLGVLLPLYVAVLSRNLGDPALEGVVSAFGAARIPDLAFTYGFSCAALLVPMMLLTVGKMGPAGRSVSEQEIERYYTTTVAVPTGMAEGGPVIPSVAVSFAGEGAPGGEDEGAGYGEPGGFGPVTFADEVDEDELAREILAELDLEMKDVLNESLSADEERAEEEKPAAAAAPVKDPRLAAAAAKALGPLGQVTVPVEIEFGTATIHLSDWINLMEGQLLKLDKPVSDAVDILISRRRVGSGQLSQVGDRRAVVVSHIDVEQVLKSER